MITTIRFWQQREPFIFMQNTDLARIAETWCPIDLPFTNIFLDTIISKNVTSGIKQARHLEEKIAAELDELNKLKLETEQLKIIELCGKPVEIFLSGPRFFYAASFDSAGCPSARSCASMFASA